MTRLRKRLVVIGGGFSGVAFCAQALALEPGLRITIIEPNETLGRGLAYCTDDPDHRLNAPSVGHTALVRPLTHFHQSFLADRGLERDPQAQVGEILYPRRADFGRYLRRLAHRLQAAGQLRHCRDRAVSVERATNLEHPQAANTGARWQVSTATGLRFEADAVVLATGHLPGATPPFVTPTAAASPAYVDHPWRTAALAGLSADAHVLLLGGGLTAADMVATLIRQGHRGPIELVSRRGLRPQPLPPPSDPPPRPIFERLQRPVPSFLAEVANPPTVRGLLRALRRRIAAQAAQGIDWYDGFDDLRDAWWRLWPQLTPADQYRFQRHLKPWFDTYRYRMPPQTGRTLAQAEAAGQLRHHAARVLSLDVAPGADSSPRLIARWRERGSDHETAREFDAVVNCTGLGQKLQGADPFIDALLAAGLVRAHASGIGLDADHTMAAIGAQGKAQPNLRIIGPPAAGALGDAIGVVFICAHIDRMLPGFIESLRA